MILMHEDWHRDTLGRSWNIYAVIAGFAPLCSALFWSGLLYSACSARLDFDSACLTKHRTATILHPDFSGRRFACHMCTIMNGRIIRGNSVPDDLSLSLSLSSHADRDISVSPYSNNARLSMSELSKAQRVHYRNRPAFRSGFRFAYSFEWEGVNREQLGWGT